MLFIVREGRYEGNITVEKMKMGYL